MSLGAPPGPATAPGSPPHGSGHWWAKRLTSFALVPLTIWFVPSMAMLAGKSHGAVVAWLGAPLNAILMTLVLATTFSHLWLGLGSIIDDYVQTERHHIWTMIAMKIAIAVLALASFFAVAKIAFGA
jgi:succinate dehydrogenase / fumarate reductase membrane anchor subunit